MQSAENFHKYKFYLENSLINYSHVYAGDIIKSHTMKSVRVINDDNYFSSNFVKNIIWDIWQYSYENMKNKKSDEILKIIKFSDISNYTELITKLYSELITDSFNPKYYFIDCQKDDWSIKNRKNRKKYEISIPSSKTIHLNNYGGDIEWTITGPSSDCDDVIIYITDRPIQCFIYSLQNMEYRILKNDIHEIEYCVYDCEYKCICVRLRDLKISRNITINRILNENK